MRGWVVTLAAGAALAMLAMLPQLDDVPWRALLTVLPWLALLTVPLALIAGAIWWWKGRGW